MARFSEEEIETLQILVDREIDDTNGSWGRVWAPEYVPFLQNLMSKLQQYTLKHHSEDLEEENESIFKK